MSTNTIQPTKVITGKCRLSYSHVWDPVSIDGKRVGAIGVIGPKRMDYKKVIAGLNYIVAGLSGHHNENGDITNE